MAIIAGYKDGGDFEHPPTGLCAAVCCDIEDLGLVDKTYPGKPPCQVYEVRLYFQTHHTMKDGRRFVVSQKFTNSLSDTANLRKFLEKWNDSKKMSPALCKNFDLEKLIGKAATLNLVESIDKKERKWTNIDAIMNAKNTLHMTGDGKPLTISADYVRKQDRPKDEKAADKTAGEESDQGGLFGDQATSASPGAQKPQQGASTPPQQAVKAPAADLDTDPFAEDGEADATQDGPF